MSHGLLREPTAKVRTVLFISHETFLVVVAIGHRQVVLRLSVISDPTAPTVVMKQIMLFFLLRVDLTITYLVISFTTEGAEGENNGSRGLCVLV